MTIEQEIKYLEDLIINIVAEYNIITERRQLRNGKKYIFGKFTTDESDYQISEETLEIGICEVNEVAVKKTKEANMSEKASNRFIFRHSTPISLIKILRRTDSEYKLEDELRHIKRFYMELICSGINNNINIQEEFKNRKLI